MDKLLYRVLISKAPFSLRSSTFRQAIFCTIWSKPTFPTCLYGSILLFNNRCSLDRSFFSEILCHYKIKCKDESQSFSVHSRWDYNKCFLPEIRNYQKMPLCVNICFKTSLPRQLILNIILKEFWIVFYKIVRSYKCLNGSFVQKLLSRHVISNFRMSRWRQVAQTYQVNFQIIAIISQIAEAVKCERNFPEVGFLHCLQPRSKKKTRNSTFTF